MQTRMNVLQGWVCCVIPTSDRNLDPSDNFLASGNVLQYSRLCTTYRFLYNSLCIHILPSVPRFASTFQRVVTYTRINPARPDSCFPVE